MDLTEDHEKKTHVHFFHLRRLTSELCIPLIIDPATLNYCQLYPHYLALTKKKFSQIGQELRGAVSHGSNWRRRKKVHIHFFSPREVNVGARHSSNNWPSYSKLLSTIATLSGSYQKKIQSNRSRIKRGSQSCNWKRPKSTFFTSGG